MIQYTVQPMNTNSILYFFEMLVCIWAIETEKYSDPYQARLATATIAFLGYNGLGKLYLSRPTGVDNIRNGPLQQKCDMSKSRIGESVV